MALADHYKASFLSLDPLDFVLQRRPDSVESQRRSAGRTRSGLSRLVCTPVCGCECVCVCE